MDSIDITPSPRVLRMLGEIDFKAWQCLCEIIDNSIDSFRSSDNFDSSDQKPSIKIKLPGASQNQLKTSDYLTIEDNGEGMTIEALNKSLKAGFSGNNPVDKMGLFGMGFNISTARLGSRTEVITSTKDTDFFLKVTIDFQELEKKRHFQAPVIQIPKKADEKHIHGTTVAITKLRTDHIKPLYQRKKITAKLGKIYGRIIREKSINLVYAGQKCKPFKHCVWSESRNGQTKAGPVPAIINIDHVIDSKKYCMTCWVWLSDFESECPSCSEISTVTERERRVKGWIGIQRYFSSDHYGIDLIRNGRVIEELDKSFFSWTNQDDEEELEYPIDGHQRLGRIVGELELDFVKVTHQKDSFDKNTQDWRDVVLHIRGDAPIRPRIAKNLGHAINTSPLAKLFSAFRTSKAGIKNLVPQRSTGQAMITDSHIEDMKRRFYDGETDYQSDEKWWELVNEAHSGKKDKPSDDNPSGGNPFDSSKAEVDVETEGDLTKETEEETDNKDELLTEPDIFLSKNYSLEIFKNVSIRVVADRVAKGHHENGFQVVLKGVELQFTYWPNSPVYRKSLLTPADFLINELAYHMHSIAHNEVSRIPITAVELAIRDKYFSDLNPSIDELLRQVTLFIDDLIQHLRSKTGKYEINLSKIESSDLSLIKKRLAQNDYLDDNKIDEALKCGEFLAYAPFNILKMVIVENPHVVFDGTFFSQNWDSKNQLSSQMEQLRLELTSLLEDIDWFNDNHAAYGSGLWRGRVRRLVGSLEILMNWRA